MQNTTLAVASVSPQCPICHRHLLVPSGVDDGRIFVATCACGWSGKASTALEFYVGAIVGTLLARATAGLT
jgi:hypothetical protein